MLSCSLINGLSVFSFNKTAGEILAVLDGTKR